MIGSEVSLCSLQAQVTARGVWGRNSPHPPRSLGEVCWASRGDATPEERSWVSQTVPSVGTSSVPRVRAGYIVFCYNCVLNCVLNYKGKKLAETGAASQENQTEIFIFFFRNVRIFISTTKLLISTHPLHITQVHHKIFSHYGFHCKQTTQTQLNA